MRDKLYLEQLVDLAASANPKELKNKNFKEGLEGIYSVIIESLSEANEEGRLESDDYYGSILLTSFLEKFLEGRSKVYRIAERFGDHLDKTNLSFTSAAIPYKDGDHYFIEFPKPFVDPLSGDLHKTVIIFMGTILNVKHSKGVISLGLKDCSKGLVFLFPDYDKNGKLGGSQTFLRLDPTTGNTVEEIIGSYFKMTSNSKGHMQAVVAFSLKCLLYIKSGDPDLRTEKAKPLITKNPKKIRRHLKEHCPFDLVNVGYDFHHKHYSAGETEVVGHFRWQPCGPGRTQVKLIWIDEHKRTYTEN